MNITFCGHKASHSWVEQLAAGGGGGANQIKDGTFHNAARSSRQPATQGSLGPAQTISPYLVATITISTELELEMSLCMTTARQSLHRVSTPVSPVPCTWGGWLAGRVRVFTSSSIMRVLSRCWALVKCEN